MADGLFSNTLSIQEELDHARRQAENAESGWGKRHWPSVVEKLESEIARRASEPRVKGAA